MAENPALRYDEPHEPVQAPDARDVRRAVEADLGVQHIGLVFEQLPAATRRRMREIANSAPDSASALPAMISELIGGGEAKRTAVLTAIRSNRNLQSQWQRAYEALRAEPVSQR